MKGIQQSLYWYILSLPLRKSGWVHRHIILQVLVMHGVCLRLLFLCDDGTVDSRETSFLEWILNQELESTSKGKKSKYQIVDAMLAYNGDIIYYNWWIAYIKGTESVGRVEMWWYPNCMPIVQWEMAIE